MADFELFPDEEEEAAAEEGANRTFIILVGALGGLLAVGICAFVAWAFFIAPGMREDIETQNQTILATHTAEALAAVETTTAETVAPTGTLRPTRTETPTTAPETPPATPREVAEGPTATTTPREMAEGPTATKTPRPTATRRPTATPRPGSKDVPSTGISVLGASTLAVGLLLLLVVVRRIRQAV